MKRLLTLLLMLLPLFAIGQDSTANDYYNKGMDLYRTEQSHLAIPFLQKSDSLEMAQLDKKSDNYNRSAKQLTICYSDLANFFFKISNPDLAIENQIQATKYYKRVYGKKHPEYVTAKKTLAKMKFFFSGKAVADDYYNHGMEIKQDHPYHAFAYFQKADTLEKATLDPSSPNYYRSALEIADIKNGMADYWFSIKSYAAAISYKTYAAEIFKKALGEENDKYINALWKLCYFYEQTHHYDECYGILTEIAKIFKEKNGEESEEYISMLSYIGYLFEIYGNKGEALKTNTQVLELIKKKFGEEHIRYIEQLDDIGAFYERMDNNEESIRLKQIKCEITKRVFGAESREYALALTRLASPYSLSGNDTAAIRLGTKALEIQKKVSGDQSSEYAALLSDMGYYHVRAALYGRGGSFAEAIRYQKMAVDVWGKNAEEDERNDSNLSVSRYGLGLYVLAHFCALSGDSIEAAVRYLALGIEHEKEYRGHDIPYSDEWWENLADDHVAAGQYDKGAALFKKIYDSKISELTNEFAGLSNEERSKKWNSNFYREKLPYAAYKSSASGDTILAALAYNGLVLSKGFLLNSEFEIQNIIEQKGSPALKDRYYRLKSDRAKLDSLYQIQAAQRTIDADSLAKAIINDEHELGTLAFRLGDYIGNLAIDWTVIQKKLKTDAIAIEFEHFYDWSEKDFSCVAIVLKKGMKSPACVKLFNISDLRGIKSAELYKTSKLYDIIWKPLAKYLDGVKTVFFSPEGQLHTIAIESLPDDNGKIFAEKYDAYRLSSTRELALNHAVNPSKKATTYGGIKYDFTEDDWRNVKFDVDTTNSFRDVPQIAESLRGSGMVNLEGTRAESSEVAKLLRTADYDVDAISDADATEESFKHLSGTGIKILHIGTHGFYESQVDLENAGLTFFTNSQAQTMEDRSLSCSGLLFAGANSALDPKRIHEIPQGADDGILTAKEISRLDFRGMDLVVLSACQTGLGEITGDGVFGLQRGFKKAGAQTLVMSLWKVADESTQLLMVEFFKNLTVGQSKRAAFTAAQKCVREKFPNPLHWAAFVMVDGLD